MRKLILIAALLATSTAFAQAGESRSLSLAGVAMTESAKPISEVSMQLAQAATAPTQTTAPVQAPAQAQAPAAITTTATTTEPKSETKTTETKPAKPAKKVTRESDEHKARRIAAKYGVYW
jgi:outer membrane biosynthesis protein TonB